jgi:hypothetical protein
MNGGMIVHNEQGRMWKEMDIAWFEVLSQIFPGRTEGNHRKPVRIISVPSRIWTEHLLNINQKQRCWRYLALQKVDKNKMGVNVLYASFAIWHTSLAFIFPYCKYKSLVTRPITLQMSQPGINVWDNALN